MGKRRNNPLQLALNILPIDEKATRRAVEDFLEEVRIYRQIGFVRRQAAKTPSYEPRYHGTTNVLSKPTEKVALWNVDREAELHRKSELLDLAMSRLSSVQREVIERSYLNIEDEFDYMNSIEMGISDRTYRRLKFSGIRLLAAALKLEK
ncbi:ArpU family phage packaging/lysis transcriptional regulator [Priestia sp. BR_2]